MHSNYLESLFSLEGKVAVVTGAAGYFGKAFSDCLLSSGAKVVLLGRGKKIKEICIDFQKKYGSSKVECYSLDFFKDKNFRKILQKIVDKNKAIDILVNNAYEFSKETGFNDASGKIENISKKQWMRGLESGIYWHALTTQVIGEKMKSQKSGSIINVSSMYGLVSPDPDLYKGVTAFNPPSYGAAKAAIIAFTRYAASFYGRYNIRCNALAPGSFPNLDASSYNSPCNIDFIKRLSDKTVLRRVGRLDDLKGALIFLASDASSYITGQTIIVDGGWTIR